MYLNLEEILDMDWYFYGFDVFIPYLIGLIFGFIYFILFFDVNNWKWLKRNSIHFIYVLFLGVLINYIYVFLFPGLLDYGMGHRSCIETNGFMSLFAAISCFISSLIFFGVLPIKKITIHQMEVDASIFRILGKLFFNFYFIWLLLNAVTISLFYSMLDYASVLTFTGFNTAFLITFLFSNTRKS